MNGKKIEIAVKQIVSGSNLKPSGTVANPESLQLYYKYRDIESVVGVVKARLWHKCKVYRSACRLLLFSLRRHLYCNLILARQFLKVTGDRWSLSKRRCSLHLQLDLDAAFSSLSRKIGQTWNETYNYEFFGYIGFPVGIFSRTFSCGWVGVQIEISTKLCT